MWSVGTILNGLLSFMYENNITTGSISSSKAEKRRLASISLEQNLRSPVFRKLFPEWVEEHHRRQNAKEVNSQVLVRSAPGAVNMQMWIHRLDMQIAMDPCTEHVKYVNCVWMTHDVMQEQEAIRQAQPAKQPVPVAAAKAKSTLGSTLITLSIVASVFALLMVPLFSK
jgi:hypothetical protein